ncbi:MAG: Bax inhibitor-1/YccA family protein [Polyangiales bacterium]
MSWETQVNSGNPDFDRQTIEHYRTQARASGMDLQVQPMPSGGFHVRAVPFAQQQQSYQQAPPQQQQPQQQWGAQPAYAAASPSPAAQAPSAVVAQPLSQERVKYLRKVYGLLASAAFLAIFSGFAVLELLPQEKFLYKGHKVGPLSVAVVEMWNNPVLMYGAFGLLVLMTFVASWTSKVKVLNVIMLMVVAVLMGVELAPMVMIAQLQAGLGQTLSAAPVRDAGMMTGAVFAGVTGYVFITRKDFSYLGAIVSMGVLVVFCACICAFFLQSEIFTLAVCSVGALVAGLFLLWQTSYVLRGDMDDPVEDALVFLVQLRNLFMFLLRIFMSRD